MVLEDCERSPKKGIHKHAQQLNLSKTTTLRILKEDIKGLYPYMIQTKHRLSQNDMDKRTDMCQWFLRKIEDDSECLQQVWFSDHSPDL